MEAKIINTVEGNKLIAEFMGFDFNRTMPGLNGNPILLLSIEDCRYHTSWDWLIPVIEQIERGGYRTRIWNGTKGTHYIDISKHKTTERVVHKKGYTKIEAVWLAVVGFIQWYNKNNQ